MHNGDFGNKNHVLTSWKEIANYLGKGVRTVQRWEKDFGLPVRRPNGSEKSAILARPQDLDAWVALRCSTRKHQICLETPRSLALRSSLAAGINTSLQLRDSNLALVSEVRSALAGLQTQIMRMQQELQAPFILSHGDIPQQVNLPEEEPSASLTAA